MSGLLALDSGECEYINEYNRNDYLYSIPERDSVINCKSLDIEQIRIRLSHLAKYVTKNFSSISENISNFNSKFTFRIWRILCR